MDVGGSFLELACARVALIPIGAAISDARFEEIAKVLTSCREVPLNALPRRAALSKPSGSATFSTVSEAFRETTREEKTPKLVKSRSAGREVSHGPQKQETFTTNLKPHTSTEDPLSKSAQLEADRLQHLLDGDGPETSPSSAAKEDHIDGTESRPISQPGDNHSLPQIPDEQISRQHERGSEDLDLHSPEVGASFRIRFEAVRRDTRGGLLMRSASEWDEFHSSRTWGVIGIFDSSQSTVDSDNLNAAYAEFATVLSHFKNSSVRRLMVLTGSDTSQSFPPVISHEVANPGESTPTKVSFSVGFVPDSLSRGNILLELRAQVTHFAGLLLGAIDRDCWKRRESPHSELFLSPIDERHSTDRQSKLAKRRAGRLDKLLADSLLLMGSPREALVKYNSAIERSKASSDRLWLAGAMEGWSAAHVLIHLGSGGRANDPVLGDLLVEHYAEIYKLYQKKRAAEPEAGAALRLAEYLGAWTSRRRDALSAAQHAASVGEGLKAQKRAALWEALARFSERMGCRRKAALFLYRLGHLNASQASWSSAAELMLAAEGQLLRKGTKPWASLSRQILLIASRYSEEASDSATAARLLVEALVVSPNRGGNPESDEAIVQTLQRCQVPSFLPGSRNLVYLEEARPRALVGSSFRMETTGEVPTLAERAVKSGPFIYNPFEVEKKARAAAVARKVITWVSGEPAYISVDLRNRTSTGITFELITALFGFGTEPEQMLKFRDEISEEGLTVSSTSHSKRVKNALDASSKLAKTKSESIYIEASQCTTKTVTVVPKRIGSMCVIGLLVRMFGGALVILPCRKLTETGGTVINVIPELPILSLSCPTADLASKDSFCGRRAPITVFDGETRKLKLTIRNTGKDTISWVSAEIHASNPAYVSAHLEGASHKDLQETVQNPGSSVALELRVHGGRSPETTSVRLEGATQASDQNRLCVATLILRYEGRNSCGITRESKFAIRIKSEPAIRLDRVQLIKPRYFSGRGQRIPCYLVVELSNVVSVPADVIILDDKDACTDVKVRNLDREKLDSVEDHQRCLLESEASVRLVQTTYRYSDVILGGHDGTSKENGSLISTMPDARHRINWYLPALGRKGSLSFCNSEECNLSASQTANLVEDLGQRSVHIRPRLELSLRDSDRHLTSALPMNGGEISCVRVGEFMAVSIKVCDLGPLALDSSCELDATIESGNGTLLNGHHWASLAGLCRSVPIALMKRDGDALEHRIGVRVLSAGTFRILVHLRTKSRESDAMSHSNSKTAILRRAPGTSNRHDGKSAWNLHGGSTLTAAHQPVKQRTKTSVTWATAAEQPTKYRSAQEHHGYGRVKSHLLAVRPATVDMYRSEDRNPLYDIVASASLLIRASSNVKGTELV